MACVLVDLNVDLVFSLADLNLESGMNMSLHIHLVEVNLQGKYGSLGAMAAAVNHFWDTYLRGL